MRVALLHSFYSSAQSSGENVAVAAQAESLARAGHEVLVLGRRTDDEERLPGYKAKAAWRTLTNRGPNPAERLAAFAPDVVHVHNTVPNIGTTWVDSWRGPIVHTLHNFRPLCSNGLLFRDGHLCTECPDGRPWAAVEHGCYRDSRLASLPIAVRNAGGLADNPLLRRSDALVVLSTFARSTYVRYGVPESRLRQVPNGVSQVHSRVAPVRSGAGWIAVGRLRAEKGMAELVAAWPRGERLDIAGDGPLRSELERRIGARESQDIRLLGQLDAVELRRRLPEYRGLVFSSLGPEAAAPLVVIEALEAGIPVAIIDTSPHAPELVGLGVASTVRTDGPGIDPDSLNRVLDWVRYGNDALRLRCRSVYEQYFTEADWVERITQVYDEVSARRRRPGGEPWIGDA